MKVIKILIRSVAFVGLYVLFFSNANAENCALGWSNKAPKFESTIQYDDMQSKANPTVHVLINGRVAKMMLDTGAQTNGLWDASLLDETPSQESEKIDAHVLSVDARRVTAALEDSHGNVQRQDFLFVPDSILAATGYAGILSPQTIAGDNAVVMDFEKNCFFVSAPSDIRFDDDLDIRQGATIANPYDVIAIPVELDGKKIPVVVDTGASITSIFASLVAFKPKGKKSPRSIDVFGAEIPRGASMRLVDLKINGQLFKSHPVIPKSMIDDRGFVDYGYIGMDILKGRVVYLDKTKHQLILLTRPSGRAAAGSGIKGVSDE